MTGGSDTRILNIQINNKQFLKGAADSLRALTTLNTGIDNATKGDGLRGFASGIDTIKTKFSALQVAGVAAIGTIASKLTSIGLNAVKSLTLDPLVQGFHEYEKLLTSTQIIKSNTSAPIKDINAALNQLNHYSDQTIYNFGQMADNIGRFTAAGVGLKESVVDIKGLANAAALAGSSAEDLNRAMYQTSQALATGVIKLIDFKSLQNANLGGKNFQESLKLTARTLDDGGAKMDAAIKKHKSFNASLTEGWLTNDVFNKTMKVFAGYSAKSTDTIKSLTKQGFTPLQAAQLKSGKTLAYTVEQLKDMGFTAEGSAAKLHKISAGAIEAATRIKTFSQLMDVVKEALGSGFAQIFRRLFGDLEESGKLWTSIGNTIQGAIGKMFGGIDAVLKKWHETKDIETGLTGFQLAIKAFSNVFKAIGNVFAPLLGFFRKLLPGTDAAGNSLFKLTKAFYNFSVWLEKVTSGGSKFSGVMGKIGHAIGAPIKALASFLGGGLLAAGEKLGEFFQSIDFSAILLKIADGFNAIGEAIGNAFSTQTTENILSGFSVGILGGILFIIKGFIGKITTLFSGGIFGGGGFLDSLKNSFQSLTVALQSMQTLLQAKTLKEIAIAVALLAASLLVLSLIDPKKLGTALAGLTGSFVLLLGSMAILTKITTNAGFIKIPIIAGSLILLSTAILILSAALKVLSTLSWEEIAKGLTTLGGILLGISVFTNTLGGSSAKILAVGLAMIPLAVGITLLAGALKIMATMSWKDIAKGLTTLAGALLIIGVSMRAMPLTLPITAAGLVLVGAGINLIALALGSFAKLSWKEIGKGLAAVTAALVLIGLAMRTMPLTLPITAAGLVLVSVALLGIAKSVEAFSGMSWKELGKGLAGLGGALLVLAAGLALMSGTVLGAVALGITAAALALLIPELIALGSVSWEVIGKGLAALAGALLIIGVAGAVAGPGLLLVGAGIILIGTGVLLAGTGVALLATGLAALGALGKTAISALVLAFQAFLAVLPTLAQQFGLSIVALLAVIAEKMPVIVASLVKIASSLLEGVQKLSPEIVKTIITILSDLLDGFLKMRKKFLDFAFDLVIDFLDVIQKKMPTIIKKGTTVIVSFIQGMGKASTKIVTAAGDTMLTFLEALDAYVQENSKKFVDVGISIGVHMAAGILKGLAPGNVIAAVKEALKTGKNPKGSGKSKDPDENARGTDFFRGGLSLVGEAGPELVSMNRGSAVITNKNLVGFMKSVTKLSKALSGARSNVKTTSGGNINYVVSADFQGDPRRDGLAFAANIVDGLVGGLQSRQAGLNGVMASLGSGVAQSFADILGIQSPSKVFQKYGDYVSQGFIKGLLESTSRVAKAASKLGEAAMDAISRTIADGEIKLEAIRGEAEGFAAAIEALQKISDDEDTSEKKKKKIDKAIEALQKQADAAQKAADKQAALVEEQNAAADRQAEFDKADTQGKADIRKEDAATAAQKASDARELALSLKKQADIIRKFDESGAKQLDKNAQTALARAKRYSDDANDYAKQAYNLQQQVKQEIDAANQRQIQSVTAADVTKAQSAFEAYTKALADAQAAAVKEPQPQTYEFTQINNSPEAISAADAYVNGKSLVSLAKKQLANTGS